MKIGDFDLEKHVFIIAEIGANHEGDIELARLLIQKAAKTGVDAVKFQNYLPHKIISGKDKERFEHFRRLALKEEDFPKLAALAREEGLIFLSTPFYLDAVDLLAPIVLAFKIASGDITYKHLLQHVASKGKPILLSTGMSTTGDVQSAIETIKRANPKIIEEKNLLLLHCVSAYPSKPEEANLRSIPFLKETFQLPVGYSDHVPGLEVALYAVAAGACLIEKHFTFDKTRQGFRDHQLSADPDDMVELVKKVRVLEAVLGDYKKEPVAGELANRESMRRSLVARVDITVGSEITDEVLTALRPETGIPVVEWERVVGKKARRDIGRGEILSEQDLT
ncbi:N-acetylneuraminate synthase family protein [Chloroflexota bacterium]